MIANGHITHAIFEKKKKFIGASNKTMVNHAKSDTLKRQIARKVKDNLMGQALALYQTAMISLRSVMMGTM